MGTGSLRAHVLFRLGIISATLSKAFRWTGSSEDCCHKEVRKFLIRWLNRLGSGTPMSFSTQSPSLDSTGTVPREIKPVSKLSTRGHNFRHDTQLKLTLSSVNAIKSTALVSRETLAARAVATGRVPLRGLTAEAVASKKTSSGSSSPNWKERVCPSLQPLQRLSATRSSW